MPSKILRASRMLAAALLLPGLAFAQTGADAEDAMMEAWQKAAAPGEPHAFLAGMAGDWKAVATHYVDGAVTESNEGTASFECIMDGRHLLGRYSGKMMGQPHEGLSLDGYDNVTGEYWSAWLDNTSTGLWVMRGRMLEDGRTVEHHGTMKSPVGDADISMRFLTTRETPDRMVMKGYTIYPGADGEQHTLTVEYTRAGS